ncbi:MAG TPA: IS3 family transposase [Gemmatimonadales bacterium]|nr:IS3 family transposase [Gemmatimonadales bacterium]
MSKTRRNHGSAFKAKVALEALKGELTVAEISAKHGLHPTLVNEWKRQLADGAPSVFEKGTGKAEKDSEALVGELYKQIGQQKVELDFLARKARSLSRAERHPMIDRLNEKLSLTRQCQLLGLSRSSLYYHPANDNTEDLALMALIDRQFMETPYYGSRKMTAWLRRAGHVVNRKRVRRLMRQMGLQVIWQKPDTSKPNPEHKIYPYLLRGLKIDRPNQVWATDITYIPMPKGFFYLVAIMDWHSRKVLTWRLSNTMDATFCVEALEDALATYGRPEIFNSDQGAQFTSTAFTGVLEAAGVRISMDGKGRCMDNIFVERLWRSLKYEDIYLRAYGTGSEARLGIGHWIAGYNTTRPHQALGYRTPDEVYTSLPELGLAPIPTDVAA